MTAELCKDMNWMKNTRARIVVYFRWLDVQEDDGHIERELDVCAGGFWRLNPLCFLVLLPLCYTLP